jgi:hypothetical protein
LLFFAGVLASLAASFFVWALELLRGSGHVRSASRGQVNETADGLLAENGDPRTVARQHDRAGFPAAGEA